MTNAPFPIGARPAAQTSAQMLTQAFGWMFAGLLLTAGVTAVVGNDPRLLEFAARNWMVLFFGQIALAIGIQALMSRLSATLALGLFFLYAAAMGLTVGLIVSQFTGESVASAFLSAASLFGAAAVYGATTGRELSRIGGVLGIALVGWFVAVIVNLFIGASPLGILLSLVTVVLFTVLTAFDVQRIKRGDYAAMLGSQEKASVLAALHLYIAFINIFISLLNLVGNRD